MSLRALLSDHDEFVSWRKQLHTHPELAFSEHATSAFVADKLRSWGLQVHVGLAGTGVVGSLQNGTSGRSVGLRADMDALPMQERNEFAHRSRVDGCFHGCGHDGHTAMLLAAARHLSRERGFDGTVHFIFQPAEESAGGGRVMVEQGLFERFPCDEIYALHNWPSLPAGRIAVRAGPVMAATDQWDLRVKGKAGHAAFPHSSVDAIYVATQIVQAWQGLVARTQDPTEPAVLSTTRFSAGTAYNVIAEAAQLGGTLRTISTSTQDRLERRLREVAQAVAGAWGAHAQLDYRRGYPSTINDGECAHHAALAATRVVGPESVVTEYPPSMGGEDFSFMLQACKGAYLWLGQRDPGHVEELHSAHYDFNDDVLCLGASLHVALVVSRLAPQ